MTLLSPLYSSVSGNPGYPSQPNDPGEATQLGGGTQTLTREEEQVRPGDNERFAHYVNKDRITEAMITGKPVVALCGKVWIPSRNPDKFPICPACKEIYEKLGNHGSFGWPFGNGSWGSSGGGEQ